ncbi:MAG: MobF family relaxase [Phycisphaerales bacterium]
MLRMTPCVSAETAIDYFRKALSRGEYYTQEHLHDQEIVGLWGGKGAERLGLSGEVDRVAFEGLCHNRHPTAGNGEQNTSGGLTPRTKSDRRVGYDLNFHAQKSVSLALELGGDRRIVDAFHDAVDATMRELEASVATRVRKGGANDERTTGNMIFSEFVHFTARPVDGVPDPHLHAHLVVQNATYDPVERRWKAADLGDIIRDAPYYQAAFHSRLAQNLRGLGYTIVRTDTGWEIEGVSREVIDRFSRRTQEIERLAAERGITDPEQKAELGAKTRSRKIEDASMEGLREGWHERVTGEERDAIVNARHTEQPEQSDPQLAADRALDYALRSSFEHNSVIPDKRLIAEALVHAVAEPSVTPELLWQRFEDRVASCDVLRGEHEGQMMVTTPEVWREEQEMLATVREGRGQHDRLKADHAVKDSELSQEQRDAVRHVLESTDSMMVIRGRAGVGKTRLMKEVVAAIESQGVRVQAAAPTAMATDDVLRKDGFTNAKTVANLLTSQATQRELKGGVIWVDEAGLLSMPDMAKLIRLAERQDCRLLLTGDTLQHRSVMRGDALRLLETESGLSIAEVKTIRRQRDPQYREAASRLSEGDLAKGFEALEAMGSIKEIKRPQRPRELAKEYLESLDQGNRPLVVSPTHVEGREVTNALRERLRSDQQLGTEDHTVFQLQSKHLKATQKADPAMYKEGDVVQFHQNVFGGFRRGDRCEVIGFQRGSHPSKDAVTVKRERDGEITLVPLKRAKDFEVYRKAELKVAAGDRIRITKNGWTTRGKHRLNNGSIYQVKGFTKEGRIELENGWVLPKRFGHLSYGYCVTSDASQGRNVNHVIIAQSSDSVGASSLQQFYTSVTRGMKRVSVFTDDKAKLLRAIARDTARPTATEFLKDRMTPPRERGLENRKSIGQWTQRDHHVNWQRSASERQRDVSRQRGRDGWSRQNNRDRGGHERGLDRER